MFDFDRIEEYQIEITTYCNAACPQCPRNINGGRVNPFLPLCHLDRSLLNDRFDAQLCKRLRQIFFCGSYGDPIMHPGFLDILADFRTKNADLWLYVHTNGGVHDPDYWRTIAHIMDGRGQIDFGIDGLEDTLNVYRRNVQYQTVIDNARAFIDAGGRAQWNFIVFRHNQHQIEQAQERSRQLGFHNFLARRTGRFFHHGQEIELERWPVQDRTGQTIHWLEPPDDPWWRNPSNKRLPQLKKQFVSMTDYFNTTAITCDAAIGHKVAINAEGIVLPCNFFNHNLYDARFYQDSLPGRHALHDQEGKNQVRVFLESYGLDNLNIHHHALDEIFQNAMWQDLVASWQLQLGEGRLFECAMTCGQQFTKVWDQGGSIR